MLKNVLEIKLGTGVIVALALLCGTGILIWAPAGFAQFLILVPIVLGILGTKRAGEKPTNGGSA